MLPSQTTTTTLGYEPPEQQVRLTLDFFNPRAVRKLQSDQISIRWEKVDDLRPIRIRLVVRPGVRLQTGMFYQDER